MTISVVIVNWNAGAALVSSVASLVAGGAADEIVVVDNGSTDGSAAAVRNLSPSVRLIETGENLGFAAGANRGAGSARGDVLVFVNPDARVLPGAVRALADALVQSPGAGIAGGGLRGDDGRWQPAAARFGPIAHPLLDTTPGRLAARGRRTPYVVDWVYGTFMAVRRDVFRQLGGFDPRFFVYGEDMDLCFRARRLGLRTLHVPAACAVHGANLSARQRFGDAREAEVVKGEMRFYAGCGRPGALGTFRAVAGTKFALKTALAALLGRRSHAATYGRVVHACLVFHG